MKSQHLCYRPQYVQREFLVLWPEVSLIPSGYPQHLVPNICASIGKQAKASCVCSISIGTNWYKMDKSMMNIAREKKNKSLKLMSASDLQ